MKANANTQQACECENSATQFYLFIYEIFCCYFCGGGAGVVASSHSFARAVARRILFICVAFFNQLHDCHRACYCLNFFIMLYFTPFALLCYPIESTLIHSPISMYIVLVLHFVKKPKFYTLFL